MKKFAITLGLTAGILFAGGEVANAERIYPEETGEHRALVEDYMYPFEQENPEYTYAFSKVTYNKEKTEKNPKSGLWIFDNKYPDGQINNSYVKKDFWEERFEDDPKLNTEYIVVTKVKINFKGNESPYTMTDIIEIPKEKKKFKIKK